jgi:hypothetical protein
MTIQYDNLNSTISAVGSATDIPVNIQPKGTGGLNLLGSGQNLLIRSQEFENGSWVTSGGTITANTTVAPDGSTTADTLTFSATSASIYQSFNCVAGQTYNFSFYVKLGTYVSKYWIAFFNQTASSFIASDIVASPTPTTSDWTRVTYSFTIPSGCTVARVYPFRVSDGTVTIGQTFFLWGAQVELASTAGTYIPTTTTAIYGTPTLTFSGVAGLGLQSDGSLYVQPAGTAALQAQATTSTAAGGNARGANAVDWQTNRSAATMVASGPQSTVGGGAANRATSTYGTVSGGNNNASSGFGSVIVGGNTNTSSNSYSFVGAGEGNTASNYTSAVVAGAANTSAGLFNFIGGGFVNSATSGTAVTTQSATMNGTTAVTLSGSNAAIRVGQYIAGTSIGADTYVAAISGTSLTLSKIATGSTTNNISFFTPHGVVVGGGNNQATGSYSFIGGGGDAGTAGNRNTASGDWSVVAGGRANTASGTLSFIGNGSNMTASGSNSVAVGGASHNVSGSFAAAVGGFANSASGVGSFVTGNRGNARSITGINTFSGWTVIDSNFGTAQSSLLILGKQTTDATATVLTSDGGVASGNNQVILPNNSAYFFRGEVISGVTGGGDTKGWTIEGVIKRGANAAATALVGTPTVSSLYGDAGATTWAIAVTADTTNGGLAVTFTGQLATTIRTVAQIRTTEMTY